MASREASPYADPMIAGKSEEHAALVALLRAQPDGLSWPEIAAELLEVGSAVEVWDRHAPAPALIDLPGQVTLESAAGDVQSWAAQGYRLISILDEDYPVRLRGIHQAPPVIFTLGTVLADDPAVSVVGSREASAQGLAMAAQVAREPTPREMAGRGLVLSQFWPDAPSQKHAFLMRNATMSGYGLATVVVEAGEKSGARAQSRMAVEHGRQVILTGQVVVRNEWAQALLGRPGVHVASSVDGVLETVEQVAAMWDELRRLVTP